MVKKAAAEVKERAAVSRERRLALALRALLDAIENEDTPGAGSEAIDLLDELGYGNIVGIPRMLKELNEKLGAAVSSQDYASVARIGAEMDRIKAGKFHKEKAAAAGE